VLNLGGLSAFHLHQARSFRGHSRRDAMFPVPRLTYEALAMVMPPPVLEFWYSPLPTGCSL
jgi:hypothetical protein